MRLVQGNCLQRTRPDLQLQEGVNALLPMLPLPLQSKVLYGYKVDGKGGWDTPFRWQKNKASEQASSGVIACCASRPGLLPNAQARQLAPPVCTDACSPALFLLPACTGLTCRCCLTRMPSM